MSPRCEGWTKRSVPQQLLVLEKKNVILGEDILITRSEQQCLYYYIIYVDRHRNHVSFTTNLEGQLSDDKNCITTFFTMHTLRPVLYLEIRPKMGAEKGRINARLISLITDFRLIFGQILCGIRRLSNFTRTSLESKRGSDVALPHIAPEYFYTMHTVPGIAIVTS